MSPAGPAIATERTGVDVVTWLSVYVALLYFIPSKLVVGALGSAGAPSMLFGLVTLLLWGLLRVGQRRSPFERASPLLIALCCFLFSVAFTYLLAMSRPLSSDEVSPADVGLLALASWCGVLLLTDAGVRSRSRLDTLLWRLALCGAVLAVLGMAQIATGRILVDQISIPGLSGGGATDLYTRGAFPRPSGTATHPIEYGVLITILLPIALHVALHHVERGFVRWIPAAAIIAIVPLTSSRSAYVGAAIGLVVVVFGWRRRWQAWALSVGAVAVIAMSVVTPNLFNSIFNLFSGASSDPSITSRTDSFDLAFEFVAEHPLFGRGLGTFLPKYRIFDNQYLLMIVTIGFVGTILFVLIGVVAVAMLLRVRRAARDDRTADLALSLVASVAVGFVSLLFFDAFAFPMTMGSVFLVLGCAGALYRLAGGTGDGLQEPAPIPADRQIPARRSNSSV